MNKKVMLLLAAVIPIRQRIPQTVRPRLLLPPKKPRPF